MSQSQKEKDKKKKKKQSQLEAEIFAFMQKCMRDALDAAMDELFGDWK